MLATTISRLLDIDVWSATGSVFWCQKESRHGFQHTHTIEEPRPPMIEFACKKNLEANGIRQSLPITQYRPWSCAESFPSSAFFWGCGPVVVVQMSMVTKSELWVILRNQLTTESFCTDVIVTITVLVFKSSQRPMLKS